MVVVLGLGALLLAGPSSFAARSLPDAAAVARFARLGLPIYCGGRHGRYVALTFDDGPGPYSALALRILRHAHARATFFVVGKKLAYWPAIPRQEAQLGALGDHTWHHVDLLSLPDRQVTSELVSTRAALARAAGVGIDLFRPPYGATDARITRDAARLGLAELVWSIDTRDSEAAPWWQIADTVRRDVRGGSIILMHENHGQTIRALKFRILPELRARHFVTVTIPQLLRLDPPTLGQLRRGAEGC